MPERGGDAPGRADSPPEVSTDPGEDRLPGLRPGPALGMAWSGAGAATGPADLGWLPGPIRPGDRVETFVARLPRHEAGPDPEPAGSVCVVGIGDDGWDGLSCAAREMVAAAEVLVGGARHLALVPDTAAERVEWPSPFTVRFVAESAAHRRVCVLASGDPMFFGVGATLVRELGAARVTVLPAPSSASLACARLGWSVQGVPVVSAVGRPPATLAVELARAARILVLSADGLTPGRVAVLLRERGFGTSKVTVLEHLGGPAESVWQGSADALAAAPERRFADLNVVAVECGDGPGRSRVPGLPDDVYAHDGQLTKREIRAVTLAALGPLPGEVLWDVGAGSGSIGIEWMRAHPTCRAIGFETREDRAERARSNAVALGVPGLRIVVGRAPEVLAEDVGLAEFAGVAPDAVFIGGGLTVPGVVERCWAALRPGGRLVANAVVAETEAELLRHRAAYGGELTRVQITRSAPVGRFTGWRPAMPVTQWVAVKPLSDANEE
ncbi:precorrin-6y C5,15-methyltransferase (decarboxylating) subunit CbiE [Embleya sp. NBC_00888]|uniref:precorrin-6y C5,15-methyltransferase (decarboxylating) subunit CbiE n=1 Tax=Embleya sp. NBC_00888 TaxID=2975960 RepID=UPI003867AE18|nr:precorrin-6y C5,15-methyltransferase (decarboxylating) subunit CbiE [Embleya sp. NBC_00888]